MFTFESTDPREVRRYRIAQFNGRLATFRSAGSTVVGLVHSIVESKSSIPPAWLITIAPGEKARSVMRRPAPRIGAVAKDLH